MPWDVFWIWRSFFFFETEDASLSTLHAGQGRKNLVGILLSVTHSAVLFSFIFSELTFPFGKSPARICSLAERQDHIKCTL